MRIGEVIRVSGCITKEKFIAGRTLAEIERILGFHSGRFARGVAVVHLLELPELDKFELAGYTNVAGHRYSEPEGLDIERIKAIARSTWALAGFERLVKVRPMIPDNREMDPDLQYPPGLGAPQWKAVAPLMAKVVAVVSDYPSGRYQRSLTR